MLRPHRFRSKSIRPRGSVDPRVRAYHRAEFARLVRLGMDNEALASHATRFLLLGDLRHHWPGSCGPGCLGRVFPDGPFSAACKCHDFAYKLGGTRAHFKQVEREFRRQLIHAASEARAWPVWMFVAFMYSAFTRVWGWHLRRWRRADQPLTPRELRATEEYRHAVQALKRRRDLPAI